MGATQWAVVLAACVGVVACGGSDDEGGGVVGGVLVDHVVANGTAYEVTCARPDPAALGRSVALDGSDARFSNAVDVEGEAPAVVLALEVRGRVDRCPSAEWVLAYSQVEESVDEATTMEYGRLRCLLPEQPDDERCIEGGPFWFSTDPSVDGTEGDGRSAVWVAASHPEPTWRVDPLEVVAREVREDQVVPDSYRLRRVGLRVVSEAHDVIVVEAVYQWSTHTLGGPLTTEQREQYTLSRLAERDGWYPTAFIVAQYGETNLSDAALDRSWADGIDRVLVEVDRR
jgi:hypothetical protein